MTDQTIPADKVREIIHVNTFRRVVLPHCRASIIDQLEALLFRHSLPTLADMTDAERRECRWMQCDVIGWSERPVIVPIHHDNGTAMVMCEDGTNDTLDTRQITPRPDLPRLEWPRDTGIPGVAIGVPVADPELIHRISDEAPPGTIVVEANLSATVRNGRYWHSAEEGHLTLAEALFYAPHEWDATAPITVVRWGE